MEPENDVILGQIKVPQPWEAFLLPVSEFPISGFATSQIRGFLGKFSAAIRKAWCLSPELFLQVWRLTLGDAADRFSDGGAAWVPQFGLGVWPDRNPPARWTVESFMDASAGEEPPVSVHKLVRIGAGEEVQVEALDAMLGYGTVLQIMSPIGSDGPLVKGREVFLPTIRDRAFRNSRFYIPLLEGKTLGAATEAQLQTWFCGASVYLRESVEDKGILIASKEPLHPVLEKLGGRLEPGSTSAWRLPC